MVFLGVNLVLCVAIQVISASKSIVKSGHIQCFFPTKLFNPSVLICPTTYKQHIFRRGGTKAAPGGHGPSGVVPERNTGHIFLEKSKGIRLENSQPLIKRVIVKSRDPSRRMVEVARVEMRHGAQKMELVTYPPKFLQARLNTLLKLKAKRVANGK